MSERNQTQEEFSLINANEGIVRALALELMQKTDMCQCQKCVTDVCAIALNNIKSRYVTSRKGEVITSAMYISLDNKIELTVAVSRAIEQVKGRPFHDMADKA